MIRYDGGLEFRGTKVDLICELIVIMKKMVERGVLDDSDIDLLVTTVRMPMKDIQAANKKFVEDMSDFDKFMMRMMTGIDADEVASHSTPTDN